MDRPETRQAAHVSGEVAFDRSVARYRTSAPPLMAEADDERPSFSARLVRGIGRWLKGAVFTLAVGWVITWGLSTAAIVALSRANWRPSYGTNSLSKSDMAATVISRELPPDPAVTPADAAASYLRLQTPTRQTSTNGFVYRVPPAGYHDPVWKAWSRDGSAFKNALPNSYTGPNASKIIPAVALGFSPVERELLKRLATDPVWRDFDRLARADRVDLIGARFVLPLDPDAPLYAMPLTGFAASKELAYAAVARAAWHLSEGRRDSALTILRSVISFGDVYRRNGVFIMDQLIGNVIVGIGRSGLEQFYDAVHDPRGRELAAEWERVARQPPLSPLTKRLENLRSLPFEKQLPEMLEIARDPAASPAVRMMVLHDLSRSSCASPSTFLFGPSKEVRDAFASARALARSPGQRAMVDLIERDIASPVATTPYLLPESMLGQGEVADVLGRVYLNPRLAKCGLIATFGPGIY